jgi:Family of unknown function (DUF5677)
MVTVPPDPGLTLAPTPAQLRRINREFVAAVRAWFPRKFYGRSGKRDAFIAPGLLRMCDTLDALMVVMTQTSTDENARVLLRSLFEQSIRLSWLLIDPGSNYPRWLSQAHVELRTIHNELAQYGETYLTSAPLAKAQGAYRFVTRKTGLARPPEASIVARHPCSHVGCCRLPCFPGHDARAEIRLSPNRIRSSPRTIGSVSPTASEERCLWRRRDDRSVRARGAS